ncbi:hypothetical protein [Azospirillum palustre]
MGGNTERSPHHTGNCRPATAFRSAQGGCFRAIIVASIPA